MKNANKVIDCLMTLLLLLLMAYSLIGELFHEITGTLMLILFLAHTWLHRKWWKTVPKGRYTAYRAVITVLNLLLLVLMLAEPLSGIAMSHHLYTFLPLSGIAGTAREIHLVLAYWSFILMSFHLGLHINIVIPAVWKKKEKQPAVRWIGGILLLLISAYGVYAFIHRGLPGYMFMQTMFAFFDFSEPVLLFLFDYLAIMILFAATGYYIGKLLRRSKVLT